MRRTDLLELMDEAKTNNGGSPDFLVIIGNPDQDGRSVDTILRHFEAEGLISSWDRDGANVTIEGYTG